MYFLLALMLILMLGRKLDVMHSIWKELIQELVVTIEMIGSSDIDGEYVDNRLSVLKKQCDYYRDISCNMLTYYKKVFIPLYWPTIVKPFILDKEGELSHELY